MPTIQEGTALVTLPDVLEIQERAGHLSDDEVRRLPKVRRGVGLACAQTANDLEKSGPDFVVPDVTAMLLRLAGQRADLWDEVIADLELALITARQSNLLADAEAYQLLRKVNNQVKAQSAFDPKLKDRFAALTEYFANDRSKSKPEPEEG